MIHQSISRKKQQLLYLIKELRKVLSDSQASCNEKVKSLVLKIRQLVKDLSFSVSSIQMKSILGGLALFIGVTFTHSTEAQVFAPPVINPFGLDSTYNFGISALADLDNDGDVDILFGEYEGIFHYYENTGSPESPIFDTLRVNPFGLTPFEYSFFPEFVDLDGDGDFDLMVGGSGYYTSQLMYFQNIGTPESPEFTTAQSNPFSLSPPSYIAIPAFADLDDDGDYDAMFIEYYGGFTYFENIGSPNIPSFALPVTNPLGLDSIYQIGIPEFSDIDEDGDYDLMVGEYYGAMKYFENVGDKENPLYADAVINPFEIDSVNFIGSPGFADFDNDGDLDMFISEVYGAPKFYENTVMTDVKENSPIKKVRATPNPTSDFLSLEGPLNIKQLEIVDIKGRKLLEFKESTTKIDVRMLKPGSYILKIWNEKQELQIIRFLKM